ncbi:hypothetical protein JTE90_012340 [Oedothorax gibbosus]|uniref:Uncharacterized protein n=1 Tax=Oedothorax gibbosus TaxID=931172 RepID=A0AAV6TJU1_9ARAC|nr:hypothetical protein JTE90_012340 [Oedothorax gibbosus]
MNFFTLTFRALGRNHIASAPLTGHRNAIFLIRKSDSHSRASCESTVSRPSTPDSADRSPPTSSSRGFQQAEPTLVRAEPDCLDSSQSRPVPVRLLPRATGPQPDEPGLTANPYPEVTDRTCRLPFTYIVLVTRNFGGNQLLDGSISLTPLDPESDDRFARQNRYGPPPEFPLASSCPGIVHHLSGPNVCAQTPPLPQVERGGSPVRPAREGTGIPNAADLRRPVLSFRRRAYSRPIDSRTC